MRQIKELILNNQSSDKKSVYEHALNSMAEAILNNENMSIILEKIVNILGKALDIDQVHIYEIDVRARMIYGLCAWPKPKNSSQCSAVSDWKLEQFNHTAEYLMTRQTWLESHQNSVHPLLDIDGMADLLHQRLKIKSVLFHLFPFKASGTYLFVFSSVSHQRYWSKKDYSFIKSVAKKVEFGLQKIQLITEHQQSEQKIWEEKERVLITLQSIGDAVITTDAFGCVQYLNPVAEQLTGWGKAEAIGMPLRQVYLLVEDTSSKAVGPNRPLLLVRRDGSKCTVEESFSPIKNRTGKIIGEVVVFRDVSERHKLLQQMTYQAYHDSLTGLPNRVLFQDRLSQAITSAQRNTEKVAVLFVDLDRFKLVNDMMGHAMGDIVLKDVALRLKQCIRKNDTIARLGGDEFTIILPRVDSLDSVGRVTEKIVKTLQKPWEIGGQDFYITGSIGIALYPHDGENAETILKHADIAMYRAKERGGNGLQFYTADMNEQIWERITMENNLRRALKRKEFEVYYQPQVNTNTRKITGMEALVRWNHPALGIILPSQFIPLAEETGLIIELGEWVLATACAQNKAWQKAGFPPMRVTVNLSMRQFLQKNLLEVICRILKKTGLEPRYLELEITETLAMQDVDLTINILQELRGMGIHIAMDDFGTGFCSLNYLKRFPINTLKIDRSFVTDVLSNPQDAAIIDTVIYLAQNLQLKIIAEGVETWEQLAFLEKRRCYEIQGFLHSEPVPAKKIESMLKGTEAFIGVRL